ncbi:MAG: S8 family serine peptidase [Betaproteobacteria bacterium]|nr:S8 family serine peptidase [Betaproteobacteria bacterium]
MSVQAKSNAFERMLRPLSPVLAIAVLTSSGLASAQTTEEKNSRGVYQIKAPALYSLGVTGLDVTAAILDTGLMVTHPEFGVRVRPGYNAFDGSSNVTDGNGHGTHVTGIIGAGRNNPPDKGMFGVAYDAFLLPIKVLDKNGFGTSTSVANGIQYAVSQRKFYLGTNLDGHHRFAPIVINLSLGSSSPSTTIANALKDAVNARMAVAAAAGNDGGANPIYPARYAKEAWANGQIIAVGAVDANNVIASWSNRAGDTKYFYLVAPGVSIYSTYTKLNRKTKQYQATYATLSGTSMATPYVAGAVALIKSGWTWLTAPQITSILFDSATDLGATGVDPVYGRGLLNLEAALAPIGSLTTSTSSGTTVAVTGTSLTGSAATSAALQAAGRAGLMQVAAFDSYSRDFQVDLAPTVRRVTSAGNSLTPMLAAVDAAAERTYSQNGATWRVAYRSEATRLTLGQPAPQGGLGLSDGGYAISAVDAGGRELMFGLSGMGAQSFGLAGELARRGEAQFTAALANPYFSLASQHMHAGIGFPVTGGLHLKIGLLVSDPRITTYDGVPQTSGRRQSMTVGEVSGQFDSFLWSAGIGRLQESDSVLGTTQTGALGFSGNTGTTVAHFGVAFSPAARLKVGAQYTAGYTDGIANRADSLVTGYTASRSEAYAVFASLQEAFRAGDSLSITVSQPLRAVSGAMQMVVPVAAAEDGSPVMASRSISLRPDGRETRAEALYMRPINRQTKWFLGVALRHQPDHDPTAPKELTIGAGLRAEF